MPFVSVTRLRIRAIRFLPAFGFHALRANSQARSAIGFQGGALLADRRWTFWTLTLWGRADDMRAYIKAGSHRTAMPKLMEWCDEASIVHWDQPTSDLPGWIDADARMRLEGRQSKVKHPTGDHLAMTYANPRLGGGGPIKPRRF